MTENANNICTHLENLPHPFATFQVSLDSKGDLLNCIFQDTNSAFINMTGLSREQVLFKKVTDVLPCMADTPLDWTESFGKTALSGETNRFEHFFEPLKRYYEVTVYSERQLHCAALFLDITERKEIENKLLERENKYKVVVEGIHDAITIVNDKGILLECNERAVELFGLESKEDFFICRPADFSPPLQPDGRKSQDVSRYYIARAMETGEHVLFEWLHQRKNGETFPAEVILTAYSLDEEMIVQSTIRDISFRKQAEADISARNQELTTLYALSTHMRAATNLAELLPIVLDEALYLLQADGGMINLILPEQAQFKVSVGRGQWESSTNLTFPLNQGISAIVYKSGKPYVTKDYNSESRALPFEGKKDTGPAVFVPLQSEEKLLGILMLARLKQGGAKPFSPAEVHLLTAVGEMAGNALRRQQLHESSRNRMEQLQALRKIDMAITGNLDLKSTLQLTLSQVTQMLNVDGAAIIRLSPDNTLKYTVWHGFSVVNPGDMKLHLKKAYWAPALLEKRTILIPDLGKGSGEALAQDLLYQQEGFVACCAVPLVARDQVQGILEVFHRKPLHPGEDWLKFLETLAGQAAIAIDNDHLFNSLERANVELTLAYDATIEGWAYALDLKDEETEGHSQRVTEMTIMLALAMGVNEEQLLQIRRGALLHDIGKMGIPDRILLKPGKLTDKEWSVMRRHPQYAREMLFPIEYLRPALSIPFCHHERWDGSGYPRGLKGEEIPLEARIFAVVDVYDALTSDRPYRSAWTQERALELISSEKGKHFDPQVVDLFLKDK